VEVKPAIQIGCGCHTEDFHNPGCTACVTHVGFVSISMHQVVITAMEADHSSLLIENEFLKC